MSDRDGITYAKPALWDAGLWPRARHLALVLRLSARCAIKGHEWRDQSPTRCARVTACQQCGSYIGASVTAEENAPCRWYRQRGSETP